MGKCDLSPGRAAGFGRWRSLGTVLCILLLGVLAEGQQRRSPQPPPSSTAQEGRGIFASSCAGCHGLDGRGGQRAPDLAANREVQRRSDAELFRIVENGVPGTSMPAFHSLGESAIKSVVSYLRALPGKPSTAAVSGNPKSGKAIFFGNAGCSGCHTIAGAGGFIASDLTFYGRTHTPDEARTAVVDPAQSRNPCGRMATATTYGGQQYKGVVRNEDNFSVQIQGLDGAFHFLMKSELQTLERQSEPLMPTDYRSRLSPRELDDLVGYLLMVAPAAKPKSKPADKPWKRATDDP